MPDLEYPTWDDPRLHYGMAGLRYNAPLPSYITHPPKLKPGDKPMLTKAQSLLISRAEKAADGLQQLTGIVTLVHNPEAGIRADIAAITDASAQADAAVTDLKDANTLVKESLETAYQFLLAGSRILRVPLGTKPSAVWAEAGWSDRHLKTPSAEDEVLPHIGKLGGFLAGHSSYEVTTAEITFTAVRAAALHKALSDSISGDSDPAHAADPDRVRGRGWYESQVTARKNTLIQTEKALERRMRNFASEFDDVVNDPLSPHYATVGLPRPGETTAPEKVLNVRATALGGGKVNIEADVAARADHYVFRIQIVGMDAKLRYLGSNGQPNFLARDLPAAATVVIQVNAVSELNQHGPASDLVQVVVT